MTDFPIARHNMVESQLRPNNVTDPRLVGAMSDLPREVFVPAARQALSYCDATVQVLAGGEESGSPRYMMDPMTFGRLVQLAGITGKDLVLDIGCGTGYSAAVLGSLAESVVALEDSESAAEEAGRLLNENGIDNVAVVAGDLVKGYPQEGPYDAIVLEGAVGQVPPHLFDQLKDRGRLVAIVVVSGVAQARVFEKRGESISFRTDFDAKAEPLPGFEKPDTGFVF